MGQEPLSAWERVSQNPFAGTFVASGLLIIKITGLKCLFRKIIDFYQRGSVLCICMDSADAIENCCLLLLLIISKYIYFLTICTFMINIYVDRYQ